MVSFRPFKCDKCGTIDIIDEVVRHGLKKEGVGFTDCDGMMYPLDDEPVQLPLFDDIGDE